jgi:hypothetical protein
MNPDEWDDVFTRSDIDVVDLEGVVDLAVMRQSVQDGGRRWPSREMYEMAADDIDAADFWEDIS